MNNLIKLSIALIKGAITADDYADKFTDRYLSDTTGLRGNFPEALLFTTVEHYNPDENRRNDEYDADELRKQVKQVLEGKHPLYADLDYPVIDLATA